MTTSSRRDFLAHTSATAFSAWITLHLPGIEAAAAHAARARAGQQPFQVLTPEEARTLEAVAEQIIPADDTPGARDAGVVYFMDRALGTFAAGQLGDLRAGLTDLATTVRRRHGDAATFAGLSGPQQAGLLREIEQTGFFGAVRFLTVAGMFADPSYGGNREFAGWRVLGLEHRAGYQPPFGYYDREYRETGK
ncbi:MAG TPA: gluconate 2-dehydrogenase subunit 3 family protein [Gemmatimonadales bacterium]|nr:gluconate 2-dehydrogenase subunit 3 family protein [Gemmatimonadales bacterium]